MKTYLSQLSSGKASTWNLMADNFLEKDNLNEASSKLRDIWNLNWNDRILKEHLTARMIFLNKKHPSKPGPQDFRPISILSPLHKVLESRFLHELKEMSPKTLFPSQIGFIRGMDITTNIFRMYKFCMLNQNRNIFILFIDYKNAYNTIKWEYLFKTLDHLFQSNPEQVQFIKALYLNTKLRIRRKHLIPNTGLMQGSIISPILFNMCIDPILRQVNSQIGLTIEQILAFADDIAFLCKSIQEVTTLIEFLEKTSLSIGLIINKNKSAILEVCSRKYAKPKWNLVLGNNLNGIAVVEEYTYLGIKVNRTLSLESTLNPSKVLPCTLSTALILSLAVQVWT